MIGRDAVRCGSALSNPREIIFRRGLLISPRCFTRTRYATAFAATSRLVFSLWCGRQSNCRLFSLFSPPRAIGSMWSMSPRIAPRIRIPHSQHFPSHRVKTRSATLAGIRVLSFFPIHSGTSRLILSEHPIRSGHHDPAGHKTDHEKYEIPIVPSHAVLWPAGS